MARSNASPWDKGSRLAKLVAQRRTLLVLDGLEPLQYADPSLHGDLKDPAVQALRESLPIPVVGAGAASFALAGLVGRRSALIYPGRIPVYELGKDPDETRAALLRSARHEIENGADVLYAERFGVSDAAQEKGILAIGSNNADHFHPAMSVDFLQRIGQIISVALARF